MKFSVFQESHIGGRKRNEDSMGYDATSDACLLVVADGMGGHPEGEVASQLTLKTLLDLFQQQATPRLADPAEFLEQALLAANQVLVDYAGAHQMADSPRTTLVAAIVQDARLTWIHCGDSRLYLVRQGSILARTLDHSMVERDRQLGRVGVHAFPGNRNALFTCVGSSVRPIFNIVGPVALRPEDRILLCSDGLWSVVSDEFLLQTLMALPVHEAVPKLLGRAVREGGAHGDNVTCLAFAWQDQQDFATTSRTLLGGRSDAPPDQQAAT